MATRKTSEFAAASEMAAAEFLIRQGANKRLPLSVVQAWVNQLIADAGGSGSGMVAATLQQMRDGTSNAVAVTPLRNREYMDDFGFGAKYTNAKTNLNSSVIGELFSYTDATSNTPVAGSYGRGLTIPSGPKYCTQIAVENTTGVMSVRFCENDVWSAWKAVGSGGGSSAGGGPLKALMLADDAGGSTSTVLKTVMTLQVEANKLYQLDARLMARMNALTNKIRVAVGGTAGTQILTATATLPAQEGGLQAKSAIARNGTMEFDAAVQGDNNMIVMQGQIFATGAGTITIQYSSANTEYTSLLKGSSFTLQEVGTIPST